MRLAIAIDVKLVRRRRLPVRRENFARQLIKRLSGRERCKQKIFPIREEALLHFAALFQHHVKRLLHAPHGRGRFRREGIAGGVWMLPRQPSGVKPRSTASLNGHRHRHPGIARRFPASKSAES
jgi:hypothetical protein